MRIGLLSTVYPRTPTDPAGSFVRELARALAAEGHEVDVLAPEPAEPTPPLNEERIVIRHISYAHPRSLQTTFYGAGVPDNVRARPSRALGLPAYVGALHHQARRHSPRWDALMTHFVFPSSLIGARIAKGRPHLAVAHSADMHLLSRLPFRAHIAKTIAKGTTHHWFTHEAQLRRFEDWLGEALPPSRARIAPMPFTPIEANPNGSQELRRRLAVGDRFVLLCLSRLVPIKGVDVAIRAVAGVRDAMLLVAGDGPERRELERIARRSKAEVRFLGNLHGLYKSAAFSAADTFLLPSLVLGARSEGLPIALLEAMSAGLPVIATRGGGVGPLLEGSLPPSGVCVPSGNVEALREAIERVREAPRMRRALGARARQEALGYAHDTQRAAITAWLSDERDRLFAMPPRSALSRASGDQF